MVSISFVYSRAARNEGGNIDPLNHPDKPIAGATDIPNVYSDEHQHFATVSYPTQSFKECFDAGRIRSEHLLHWPIRTIVVPKEDLI